jgi:hypothetical protein
MRRPHRLREELLRVLLSGNSTLATFQIDAGSAIFAGSRSTAIVLNGGALGGKGAVGTITSTGGGSVAPGTSTGTLRSGAGLFL